jgi:hypothetical protein
VARFILLVLVLLFFLAVAVPQFHLSIWLLLVVVVVVAAIQQHTAVVVAQEDTAQTKLDNLAVVVLPLKVLLQ